jgi:hypothetical protein
VPEETESGGVLPPTAALAFPLEAVPGASTARIIWDGESPWTATQFLQGHVEDDGTARRSVIDEARVWVREALPPAPDRQRSCARKLPPGDRLQYPLCGAQS